MNKNGLQLYMIKDLKDIAAPLLFLVMFVCFIYGALFLAALGIANWLIHSCNLLFALQIYKFKGVFVLSLLLIALWAISNFIIANVVYYMVRITGHKILAHKVYGITIMALFHIFALPVILWGTIRQNSSYLRSRYRAYLKKLSRGKIMLERLEERRRLSM